jgi:hypothetical protein
MVSNTSVSVLLLIHCCVFLSNISFLFKPCLLCSKANTNLHLETSFSCPLLLPLFTWSLHMVFSSTFYHTLSLHKEPKKKIHHSFSQISLLITHVNCQPLSHQVFLQTPSLILTISFLFTNNKKKKKQKQKKTKIYSLSGLLSNTSPSPLVCRLLQQKLQIKNPIPCQKLFASPANGVSIQKFYLRCPLFHLLCLLSSLHALLFSLAAAHVIFPGSSVKPQNQ